MYRMCYSTSVLLLRKGKQSLLVESLCRFRSVCFSVDLPLLDPSMGMAKFQRLIL